MALNILSLYENTSPTTDATTANFRILWKHENATLTDLTQLFSNNSNIYHRNTPHDLLDLVRYITDPGSAIKNKRKIYDARKIGYVRRVKKRNKKKKLLPPIPPGTPGDPRVYLRQTYNINLFEYKVRRRYDVSSIPQFNYGYKYAVQQYRRHVQLSTIQTSDVTSKANNNAHYVISKQDQAIINAPDVFLRRTPPPDDTSNSTMSDLSYTSAVSTNTVIYPPTPAHE